MFEVSLPPRRATPQPLGRWAMTAAVSWTLLATTGCDKPEKPHPAGPGVSEQATAKTIEQVPTPKLAEGMSKLTAEQQATPVAVIGKRTLTLGELEARLERQPEPVRLQFGTVAKRREFLLSWVQAEVLADEAVRQGFDKDPEVLETMRSQMVRRFLEESVVDAITIESVTDDEIKAYYDANLRLYQRPEAVEVRHLQVKDMALAARLHAEVTAAGGGVPAKLVGVWQEYVNRYTEDATTKDRLGSLGLVWSELPPNATPEEKEAQDSLPAALRAAALKLQPYEVSPPVTTERGVHLLLAVSKSPALDVKLSDVQTQIRARLLKRKRDLARADMVSKLVSSAKVEVNEEAISLLPPPAPRQKLPRADSAGDGHDH